MMPRVLIVNISIRSYDVYLLQFLNLVIKRESEGNRLKDVVHLIIEQ